MIALVLVEMGGIVYKLVVFGLEGVIMFIPYSWLSVCPQAIHVCGDVPVFFRLSKSQGRDCIISLTDSHTFQSGRSVSVPVGTGFELEYKRVVCEIQLGRWLSVYDA